MKREISSVVEASTLAIAPVASGTSASVLKAAAPCQRAKRRPEDGVLVDSVMGVLRACGKRSLYAAPRARPTALRVLIDHFASRSPGHCSRDTEQPAWRHDDSKSPLPSPFVSSEVETPLVQAHGSMVLRALFRLNGW